MTFDLGIWPSTAWTYKGSHIISINQVWFQLDFNFSNKAIFTFLAYLTTWPQMTFDFDMWPLTSSSNEGSHVAPKTQLWLRPIKACGSWSQMLTCIFTTTDNINVRQQQQETKWLDVSFLLRQVTQKLKDFFKIMMITIAHLVSN